MSAIRTQSGSILKVPSRTDNLVRNLESSSSIIGIVSSETIFSDPSFDPLKYANDAFNSRTVPEAKSLVKELHAEKDATSAKMTRKVLQNYKTLLDASKEVTIMESGFAQLRSQVRELNELIGELKETSIGIEQRGLQEAVRSNRSSSVPPAAKASRDSSNAPSTQLANEVHALLDAVGQLDLFLPLRKFSDAVETVERAQKILNGNPQLAAVDALRRPLEERTTKLCAMLLSDLRAPRQITSISPRVLISLLVRLDCAEKARETFLERSSDLLRSSMKEVREHGTDPQQYTSELSSLLFSAFQNTLTQLQDAFNTNAIVNFNSKEKEKVAAAINRSNLAAFVVWAVRELDDLLESHLRKQLFQRTEDLDLLLKCIQVMRNASKTLEDMGISLTFHLDSSLREDLKSALKSHLERVESSLAQSVDEEQWLSKTQYTYKLDLDAATNQRRGARTDLQLSDSGQMAYSVAQKLISLSDVLISIGSVDDVINAIDSIVQNYLQKLLSALNLNSSVVSSSLASNLFPGNRTAFRFGGGQLSESQLLSVLLNAAALVDDLVPHARMQLETRAGCLLPEFNDVVSRHHAVYLEIQMSYARKRAEQIVSEKMDWENADYSQREGSSSAEATQKFQKLSEFVPSMIASLSQSFGQEVSLSIGQKFVEEILNRMGNASWWTRTPTPVSPAGAKQLAVDLKFLQSSLSSSPLLSAQSQTLFAQLIAKASSLHPKAK